MGETGTGAVAPGYTYLGTCPDRASYGRVKADGFLSAAVWTSGAVKTLDLYGPTVFSYGAPSSDYTVTQMGKFQGVRALRLAGRPAATGDPSINLSDPNPYICGVGIGFAQAPVDLSQATALQLRVLVPRPASASASAAVNLVVEIYENDGGDPRAIDKDPANFWLPKQDDDFFKVVIKIEPTGAWQTVTIPLARFVDWNKKTACQTPIPGINEDVGNGILDPKKGEALAVQLTMVADTWDRDTRVLYVDSKLQFIIDSL